jgi:multicomponent Na+:H+ antiporter subunit F
VILSISIAISLVALAIALLLCAYRVLRGPSVADRVVALDAVAIILMGIIVVGSMQFRETGYLAYVLVLSVLSFVATVAFAKYIQRGVIIERDPD